MTFEVELLQKLADLLAPALPYLMGPATTAGQKFADSIVAKIGEDTWNKAKQVFTKLQPWIDRDPEVAKSMREVANGDPLAIDALPWNLKKLLELIPTEILEEVQHIIYTNLTETEITTATSGGQVIRGSVSYHDARQITNNVFIENILKMNADAKMVGEMRAKHLSDLFLSKLYEINPKYFNSLADPGMQIDLFEAQKEYVRSGDMDLEQMLVGLLVERASEEQRSENRIALEESIRVVSKLTNIHLDSLTLVYLLTRGNLNILLRSDSFIDHLKKTFVPFIENTSLEMSCYEHLEYAGCGSVMRVARWPSIQKIFAAQYPEILSNLSDDQMNLRILSSCPPLQALFERWSSSNISRFDLTTVGIAIARANFRRKSGYEIHGTLPLIKPLPESRVI